MTSRTAPTVDDIRAARERVGGIARETPVFGSETLSRLAGRKASGGSDQATSDAGFDYGPPPMGDDDVPF